jgi:hypothetical protein
VEHKGWQVLLRRLQWDVEDTRSKLEAEQSEADSLKLRARIRAIRWLMQLPEQIRKEADRK